MIGLLTVGAIASLALLPVVGAEGWPPVTFWVLVGVAIFMVAYALTLLPTRLVVSDDGICQQLVFSETRLQWRDMAEWRHCDGGEQFETGDLREQTKGKLHSIEFWIKDKAGRKHCFKRWLVFGRRSKFIADIMRTKGIAGG